VSDERTASPARCPGYTCDLGRTQEWISSGGYVDGQHSDMPPGHVWYREGSYVAHEADQGAVWQALAEEFLLEALVAVRDNSDGIPWADAAMMAMRVWAGEIPDPGDLAPVTLECTCPPDLVARGGFRSTCPEHGPYYARSPGG
jgi:hypothetical protein